jgi:hypothetical protein
VSSFVPDIATHAGDPQRVANDLRTALKELKISFKESGQRELQSEFTPSPSYEAIKVRFHFPGGRGIVAAEGHLLDLDGEPHEELRIAINYLNQEMSVFRFYVGDAVSGRKALYVRHDMLPNTSGGAQIHSRELRQALTGLCAQKAIFAEPLKRVNGGASWKGVKDALRALK